MLSFRRALRLSRRLDLDVDQVPICSMCLLDVDPPWDEGLEAPLRLALERASGDAVPDAREALEDVERHGPRTTIARAAVRRLAHQLNARTYSVWN